MSKEELVAFLKENLKVQVSAHNDGNFNPAVKVKVKLLLGDEEISSDEEYADVPRACQCTGC